MKFRDIKRSPSGFIKGRWYKGKNYYEHYIWEFVSEKKLSNGSIITSRLVSPANDRYWLIGTELTMDSSHISLEEVKKK